MILLTWIKTLVGANSLAYLEKEDVYVTHVVKPIGGYADW